MENSVFESCPVCFRDYDDIDFDFQCCSKCGWDPQKEQYNSKVIRFPSDDDYLNGDADILTDEWV